MHYSSLLEQKISEPAVDALKPAGLQGLQDLSKRFSDVFDERLAQKSVSEIKPKNSFDLSSFRNRMQADGLVFTDGNVYWGRTSTYCPLKQTLDKQHLTRCHPKTAGRGYIRSS